MTIVVGREQHFSITAQLYIPNNVCLYEKLNPCKSCDTRRQQITNSVT